MTTRHYGSKEQRRERRRKQLDTDRRLLAGVQINLAYAIERVAATPDPQWQRTVEDMTEVVMAFQRHLEAEDERLYG